MDIVKEGRKAVILKYLLSKPEIETVRFFTDSDDVDVLTHETRGDAGKVPWWKHKGTIDTVYISIVGDL